MAHFSDNNLNHLVISDSVTSIGYQAFYANNLTEVILPTHFKENPPYKAFDLGVNFTYRDTAPSPTPEPEPFELPATKNNITGLKNDDLLKGTNESDFISGRKGNDVLRGLREDDVLIGNMGNDILQGGKGDDYLNGSRGTDVLTGGLGADVFQISKGENIVDDFSIGQGDRIALDRSGEYKIIEDSDGVLVSAGTTKQLLLEGVVYDDVIAAGVELFVQPV